MQATLKGCSFLLRWSVRSGWQASINPQTGTREICRVYDIQISKYRNIHRRMGIYSVFVCAVDVCLLLLLLLSRAEPRVWHSQPAACFVADSFLSLSLSLQNKSPHRFFENLPVRWACPSHSGGLCDGDVTTDRYSYVRCNKGTHHRPRCVYFAARKGKHVVINAVPHPLSLNSIRGSFPPPAPVNHRSSLDKSVFLFYSRGLMTRLLTLPSSAAFWKAAGNSQLA